MFNNHGMLQSSDAAGPQHFNLLLLCAAEVVHQSTGKGCPQIAI